LKEEIRKLSRVQQQQQQQPQVPKSPQPAAADNRSQTNLVRSPSASSFSGNSVKEEEEINMEYLRNVVFKFLESKSTRSQLIPVLTMMLKFTPEEVRRLYHAA
jgi:hypothetical protein